MKSAIDRNKILWALLTGFIFSIPLSQFISVRLLLATVAFSFFVPAPGAGKRLIGNAWDAIAFISVLTLGLLYSANMEAGLRSLETSFSLIGIPIVCSRLDNYTLKRGNQLFYSFALGLLVAGLICLGSAVNEFNKTGDVSAFLFENLTDILNTQPTYMAYYLIYAIGMGLYLNFYRDKLRDSIVITAVVGFFFILLMLSGGTTAFISLLLTFSFFVLKYVLEERSSNKTFVFLAVCLMIVVLFGLNSLDYWGNYLLANSDYWERTGLWRSAIHANPDPFLGVGTGDYKDALNSYYLTHELDRFAAESYNSHNQFIQIYFSNGLLGLVALCFLLGRPLYMAFRNQDAMGILVIFPFLIYGVTEVFLGRYQGVVFFALLHQLIALRNRALAPGHLLKVA